MAGKKENLKALFTNTRSRIIIVFTLVLLVIAVIIGFLRFSSSESGAISTANLANSPGIQSIPGSKDPTSQYASLVQQQNVQQAQSAQHTGGSAIPTIIRTQAFGNGVESIGPQNGQGGVGFATMAMEEDAGSQRSLWLQSLKDSNCSKSTVEKVVSQGATISDLKAGCTCAQLRDNGYRFTDLQSVCSCKELKASGFNARQMKDFGMTAGQLRLCGFDACELRNAGFTAQEMKDGVFSDGELKGAGFSDADIERASGLPEGITESDVRTAGCNAEALKKLKAAGVSASAIRRIKGCSAAQLKAAGFSALDLKNAGFSAADLKNAGFSPADLKRAGYSARDLLNAGFSPAELASAGFSPQQIKAGEAELPPGMSPQDVKEAGCDVEALKRERLAGVSAASIRQYAGCSAAALKAAGFSDSDLADAGFSPQEIAALSPNVDDSTIKAAGCDPDRLRFLMQQGVSAKRIRDLNGCSLAALKAAGFDAKDITDAGFTPKELLAAGFSPSEIQAAQSVSDDAIRSAGCDPSKLKTLFAEGVSAKRIHDLNGCIAAALRAAGYSAKDLTQAGFTPQQLLAAGFSPQEVKNAQSVDESTVRAAGCDPNKLRLLLQQGVSAKRIHDLNGCSAEALRAAGFDAKSLLAAGFTPQQLAAAGFSPEEIRAAENAASAVSDDAIRAAGCDPDALRLLLNKGVSAKRIRDLNGCRIDALKAAGFDALSLANAGFTPQELLKVGFTPAQLTQAGLNPSGVIAAGRTADCSVESLKAARALGVSASTIKQTLGCSAAAMKAAGYTAAELKQAGFTAAELRIAGFSAADLKAAGFSAKELRAAGFNASELKNSGLTAAQLRDAGFSAEELKSAGFSAAQLKAVGYSAKELAEAGFSADDLKNAGYSSREIASAGLNTPGSSLAGLDSTQQVGVPSTVTAIPSIGYVSNPQAAELSNAKQLQEILARQQNQMADQKSQQEIQQRTDAMLSTAGQYVSMWKSVPGQVYSGGSDDGAAGAAKAPAGSLAGAQAAQPGGPAGAAGSSAPQQPALIKTGDVVFAVLDTSVNSDEPGPILATIVSGRYKGAKLIGSFNLPSNADKMVINFNTMSVLGAPRTTSISAYAIDPNTARTALASTANHHYLLRYGSLFAATFLEGFGNAFQSAGTTITIGGTAGVQTTTVQNGVGGSVLENAVIGLATLGKSWGQVAQVQFSRPTTVELCSGTGLGILFTQDVTSL